MSSQGFYFAAVRHALITLIFCISNAWGGGFENLADEWQRDSTYLPYTVQTVLQQPGAHECAYPIGIPARVFRSADNRTDSAIYVKAGNVPEYNVGKCRFGAFFYPSLSLPDDDPIDFIITDWRLYPVSDERLPYVVGLCHSEDSIMVFRLDLETDTVVYHTLSRKSPDGGSMQKPAGKIFDIADADLDGQDEIYLKIEEYGSRTRQMYCVTLNPLEVKWSLPHSGAGGRLFVAPDTTDGRLIIISGSPANSYRDTLFDDYYSYLTILSADGIVESAIIVGTYGMTGPSIFPADSAGQFFITYAMYEPATSPPPPDSLTVEWRLGRIDKTGKVLSSRPLDDTPSSLWKMAMGPDGDTALLSISHPGRWTAYDMELNVIAATDSSFVLPSFVDYTRIVNQSEMGYVLSDGIYDHQFNKLLQFPTRTATFEPLLYDSTGAVTDFLMCNNGVMHLYKLDRRTTVELASAFYHNNQQYVLMLVTGLVVAVIVANLFRQRTKRNLATIASQKREIEHAHEKLKATQDKLMEAEKYRQAKDMAGMFAHEIRNALFPADGLLTKMGRKGAEPVPVDRLEQYHRRIRGAVGRAIDLTDVIKIYTSLDARKSAEPVHLREVLNEVVQTNRQRLRDERVKVVLDLTDTATVEGNKEQFYLVLNNLLLNSVEAVSGKEDSVIEISSRSSDDTVFLAWRDNGTGIDEENRSRIFDAFFSTKPGSGTGLGLALAKRIVEMYDGRITVDSIPGQGTTFSLALKRCEAA